MTRVLLALALALALPVADAFADAGRLSRAEFVAKGNRICIERDAYGNALPSLEGKERPQVVALIDQALRILGRERTRFKALRPPRPMDSDLRALTGALDRQLAAMRQVRALLASKRKPEELLAEFTRVVAAGERSAQSADAAAKRLGLTRCNWTD